jgi:hypothetical protein
VTKSESQAATSATLIESKNNDIPSAAEPAQRRIRRRRRARTKPKKNPRRATIRRSAAGSGPKIDFNAATIAQGRSITADIKSKQKSIKDLRMQLGQLADQVAKDYGKRSLKRFAAEIGIAACTLARCRSVFRAWKAKEAPAPKSYAVAQELQAHPNRAELVSKNPNMTKREAREHVRALRKEQPRDDAAGHRRENDKRWLRGLVQEARQLLNESKFLDDAKFLENEVSPELQQTLREIIEPTLLPTLQEAGERLQKRGQRLIRMVGFFQRLADEGVPREQVPAEAME